MTDAVAEAEKPETPETPTETPEPTKSDSSSSTGKDTTSAPEVDGESLTEDELELLSDEERAAMLSEDEDEGEAETPVADTDDGGENKEDSPEVASDEATAPAATSDDTPATADKTPKDPPAVSDKYEAPAPVDTAQHDEAIAAAEKQASDAFEAYENGEMDDAEYKKALGEAQAARDTARDEKVKAESGFETAQQKFQVSWNAALEGYYGDVPELWNDEHFAGFDAEVKQINASPSPVIQNLGMRARLELAHDRYAATMRAAGQKAPERPAAAKPKPADAPAKKAKEAAAKAQAEKPTEPPKTLRSVPAEEVNSIDTGKFAHIDKLLDAGDSDAMEAALSKLSEADYEEYMSQ